MGGFFYCNLVIEGSQCGNVYRGLMVDLFIGLEDEDGVYLILVGDLDGVGVGGSCIDGIFIGGEGNVILDLILFV